MLKVMGFPSTLTRGVHDVLAAPRDIHRPESPSRDKTFDTDGRLRRRCQAIRRLRELKLTRRSPNL